MLAPGSSALNRDEALDLLEQLKAAFLELRRRNMIPAKAMPYQNALGCYYDCGDFPANMDMALAAADYAGFPTRREQSRVLR